MFSMIYLAKGMFGWYGVGFRKILGTGGAFSSHTRFEVGNGSKVKFWHDVWCGD
jgi:hypothetical protein